MSLCCKRCKYWTRCETIRIEEDSMEPALCCNQCEYYNKCQEEECLKSKRIGDISKQEIE